MRVRLAKTSSSTKRNNGRRPSGRGKTKAVTDIADAKNACAAYIAEHGLTLDTWTGGRLADDDGQLIGFITFDGTLQEVHQSGVDLDVQDRPPATWGLQDFTEIPELSKGTSAHTATVTRLGLPVMKARNSGEGGITVLHPLQGGWDILWQFEREIGAWLSSIGLTTNREDVYDLWLVWQTRNPECGESVRECLAEFYEIHARFGPDQAEGRLHSKSSQNDEQGEAFEDDLQEVVRNLLDEYLKNVLSSGKDLYGQAQAFLEELNDLGYQIVRQ